MYKIAMTKTLDKVKKISIALFFNNQYFIAIEKYSIECSYRFLPIPCASGKDRKQKEQISALHSI